MFQLGKKVWRVWAKAIGEKATDDNKTADLVAIVSTIILLIYLVTNFVIMAGVARHC